MDNHTNSEMFLFGIISCCKSLLHIGVAIPTIKPSMHIIIANMAAFLQRKKYLIILKTFLSFFEHKKTPSFDKKVQEL